MGGAGRALGNVVRAPARAVSRVPGVRQVMGLGGGLMSRVPGMQQLGRFDPLGRGLGLYGGMPPGFQDRRRGADPGMGGGFLGGLPPGFSDPRRGWMGPFRRGLRGLRGRDRRMWQRSGMGPIGWRMWPGSFNSGPDRRANPIYHTMGMGDEPFYQSPKMPF